MAPEVIACDENPDATYDYRVRESCSQEKKPKNPNKPTYKTYAVAVWTSLNDSSFWDFLCLVGVTLFRV